MVAAENLAYLENNSVGELRLNLVHNPVVA